MEFICDKIKVREILDYHQLKGTCDKAYVQISDYLDNMPDYFEYNFFMKNTSDLFSTTKLSIHYKGTQYDISRFYNSFKERMRRYKLDSDWKDLNSPIPKMTRIKRTRLERKAKVEKINKQNDGHKEI